MEISRDWRLQEARYRLIGEVCNHCESKIFPPRNHCPNCNSKSNTEFQFSGKGEIYSFTKLREASSGFEENLPYTIAIIKLAEGPFLTAQLTDMENSEVEIGMKVEMVTRKIKENGDKGTIVYGYKFRPLLTSSSK